MAKYEAVIQLTVELDASDSEAADKQFYGDFTDKLLAIGLDTYKIWSEIIQIDELEEAN